MGVPRQVRSCGFCGCDTPDWSDWGPCVVPGGVCGAGVEQRTRPRTMLPYCTEAALVLDEVRAAPTLGVGALQRFFFLFHALY